MLLDNLSSLTGAGWLLLLVAVGATIFPVVGFFRGRKMSRKEKRVNLFCSAAGLVSLVLFIIYLATNETVILTAGMLALFASAGTGRFFKRSFSDLSYTSTQPKPKDDELAKGLADYRVADVGSRQRSSSDRKWKTKINVIFGLFIFTALAVTIGAVAVSILVPHQGTMTYEEVMASPHKVVEQNSFELSGAPFTYVNPDGVEVPLSVVCGDGLTARSCVSSEDGSVEFYYSPTRRSGLMLESEIVIDGEVMASECHYPSSSVPTRLTSKVCAPLPVGR